MSPAPTPLSSRDPQIYSNADLYRPGLLDIDTLRYGFVADEESSITSKRIEDVAKHKLPTYQAAAVVSAVLAGVESQLLVFFKSFPGFTRQPAPAMLQCLLLFTYIALIFSVSATISSLVLTENFGNVPMLVTRLREKVKNIATPRSRTASFRKRDNIAPRRWRWVEWHWLFTLLVSVLCLPSQILLYIWVQESHSIRVAISIAGVFAMLPLLHFLPIPWESAQYKRSHEPALDLPRFSYASRRNSGLGDIVLPTPVSFPVPQAARLASLIRY